MSSGRTNHEIAIYTAQVLTELEEYLHFLILQGEPFEQRADKIDQWIDKWTNYLKIEKTFNPKSLPTFERGSIVYANFGFNVGMEYGGLHYAIVLNHKDSKRNQLLHVLPLTSVKEHTDLNNLKYFQLYLDNEIHNAVMTKFNNLMTRLENSINQVKNQLETVKEKSNNLSKIEDEVETSLIEIKNKLEKNLPDTILEQQLSQLNTLSNTLKFIKAENTTLLKESEKLNHRLQHIRYSMDYAERLQDKISKMKSGSIALLNQVTTISKLRIYDPINKDSFLNGIKLKADTLNIIDSALKNIL